MRRLTFALKIVAMCAVSLGAVGCGRYAVRPDEKELLADRIMQLGGDGLETDQHVLENREGSNGGYGTGGGGCGCN